jgi:hypothetical protein
MMLMCHPNLTIDVTHCFVLRANRSLVGILHTMDDVTVRPPIANSYADVLTKRFKNNTFAHFPG